jgi:hypothetical protein
MPVAWSPAHYINSSKGCPSTTESLPLVVVLVLCATVTALPVVQPHSSTAALEISLGGDEVIFLKNIYFDSRIGIYTFSYPMQMPFRYLLIISTWPTIDIKLTLFQLILLRARDITVARIFWLSQSVERKNSAQPQNWPSMRRNVSLVNGQTDRLALPYGAQNTRKSKKKR